MRGVYRFVNRLSNRKIFAGSVICSLSASDLYGLVRCIMESYQNSVNFENDGVVKLFACKDYSLHCCRLPKLRLV